MKTVSMILLLLLLPIIPISYEQSTNDISNDKSEWKIYHAPDKFGSVKPANIFNIHYRISNGIIDAFEQIDQTFFKVKLIGENNGIFEIKIPRNYPYSNLPDSPDEYNHTENRIVILSNGSEMSSGYEMEVTDCFYIHSIEFSGNKTFELGYPQLLVGLPFRGEKVPKHCIEETMTQNTSKNLVTLTPLEQFKAGVDVEDIFCKWGFQLIIKASNGHPACVKPESTSKLVAWGWAKASITHSSTYQIDSFEVSTTIINGSINSITKLDDSNSILVELSPFNDGNLIIKIPKTMLKTIDDDYSKFSFFILTDGEETPYEEIDSETIKINFQNYTKKIEIIGASRLN